MNSSIDIVILAISRWDGPYPSTATALAKELSRRNRVFYIDNPFTIKDLLFGMREQIKKRLKALLLRIGIYRSIGQGDQHLTAVTPPLMLPINFLPAGRLYTFLARWNNWLFFRTMKRMLDDFHVRNFVFVNIFNPFYATHFPAFFRPQFHVYYTYDDIANSPYVRKHGARLEVEAFHRAPLTFATSRELTRIAARNSQKVHYLPNGVDKLLFTRQEGSLPAEFQSIRGPIIIFTGNCDHRVDYEIVRDILKKHADKTLVMIGPHTIDEGLVEELKRFPNILFLGRKKLSELSRYLSFSQCAIIPYKCNTLTKSIYPLKLNEYLACGVPVVSTPFSDDIMSFGDVISISRSTEDFAAKIEEAIRDDSEEKRKVRMTAARKNNWQSRADEFWNVVMDHMARRN